MTGFASQSGEAAGQSWIWEARSVNGKGLDLRLRLPDSIEGLEQFVRAEGAKRFKRGNIALSLRLERNVATTGPTLDLTKLEHALESLSVIEAEAAKRGIELRQSSAADILSLKGLTETGTVSKDDAEVLKTSVLDGLSALFEALAAMRASEGAALGAVITGQVDQIESLTAEAVAVAKARVSEQKAAFKDALARVTENSNGVDEARVAQEIAVLAVKSDVTEELDRLKAHINAARDLIAENGPIGRRFDFLAQEFNREANTLASKSNYTDLTRVALDLKVTIDQMREQIQNVE